MASSAPIVFFQIAARDPEATEQWFRDVFDWDITTGAGPIHASVDTHDPGDIAVNGAFMQAPEGAPSYISIFIRTTDLHATLQRAKERGATVIVPGARTETGTDFAIIVGPENLVLGIVQL